MNYFCMILVFFLLHLTNSIVFLQASNQTSFLWILYYVDQCNAPSPYCRKSPCRHPVACFTTILVCLYEQQGVPSLGNPNRSFYHDYMKKLYHCILLLFSTWQRLALSMYIYIYASTVIAQLLNCLAGLIDITCFQTTLICKVQWDHIPDCFGIWKKWYCITIWVH
jgi:hypothetical protein